jgi:hypothetical protein
MDKQTAISECRNLEEECRLLAEAFRPSASAGQTMVIPVALARQLAEALELCSAMMGKIAGEGLQQ